jgi:AcrR family transcriptional regulator
MARTLNAEVHAVRRDAFVDAAQRLIQVHGYEQMSVQDVLDEVDASRGAFYHYFDSKAALLDAVIERMVDDSLEAVRPVVADPGLSAIEKLDGVFAGIARWKGERTELMLAVLEAWLTDDNAIVRDKLRQGVARRLTPVLATILEQGAAEGTFTISSPAHAASVLVSLLQGANETAIELWFARRAGSIAFDFVAPALGAYREAQERILGLPAGSLMTFDEATLHQWFD